MAREMRDSGIEWVSMIPKEWNVTKIKFLCEMQSGDSITAQDINIEKDEINCYEVYGANGFRGYYKDYTHNGRYCLVGRQGALAGNVHIVDSTFWATDHAVVVYVNDKVSQEYMYYLLTSMNLNQYAYETAAQPGLSVSKIMNLQVICPPYIQQQIILEHLNKECAEIEAILSDIQSQISILEDYKKSIITEAVTKGLNPDVEMKDSGIEWIGEIPKEWEISKLKYILSSPLMYGANESGEDFNEEYPRYIRITDIDDNHRLKEEGKLSLSPAIAMHYLLAPNDILFARSGASVGKTFLYKEEYGKAAFAGYLIKAHLNEEIVHSKYIYYSTLGAGYDNWKKSIFTQATIQNIGADKYAAYYVPVPQIEEQQEIVKYLDRKCAEIDVIITKKGEQLDVLEQYKKSMIYECVTGKKEVVND